MTNERIMDEAIAWTIRLRHADAGDWQAFTDWLDSDPGHLPAYEEVAEVDSDLTVLLANRPRAMPAPAASVPPLPMRPVMRRRSLLAGGAAALAATFAAVAWLGPETRYQVETGAGERRSIALDGGTRIHLNGTTRLLLDRSDSRFARLEQGEALFAVVRRPNHPFRVEAGPTVIRNIGTTFNVLHEGAGVEVAVAEGAVMLAAGGREVALAEGDSARVENGRMETGRRDPGTIGAWRQGELVYSSASFAEIARDLSRSSGLDIRATPGVAERRFSGVIRIEDDHEQLRRRLSALLDVDVRLADGGWILAPHGQ